MLDLDGIKIDDVYQKENIVVNFNNNYNK